MSDLTIMFKENYDYFESDLCLLFANLDPIRINYELKGKTLTPHEAKEKIRNFVQHKFYNKLPKEDQKTIAVNALRYNFSKNLEKAEIEFI